MNSIRSSQGVSLRQVSDNRKKVISHFDNSEKFPILLKTLESSKVSSSIFRILPVFAPKGCADLCIANLGNARLIVTGEYFPDRIGS